MSNNVADLIAEGVAIDLLDAEVIGATDVLGVAAMEGAIKGWEELPLRGKAPAIANPHPQGSVERKNCKGECGRWGHGFYDATTDLGTIAMWWGLLCPGANIGVRLPSSVFAIDIDPRYDGPETVSSWAKRYGPLPTTYTTISGRGDGGVHFYFRHPGGSLSGKRLKGTGVDFKDRNGFVIAPPSIHPDSGRRYVRSEAPIAEPPDWLIAILRPEIPVAQPSRRPRVNGAAGSFWAPSSIADKFCASASWADVLEPHGWHCLDADPDEDGSRWLHPAATSSCSATVRHDCLFIYSTNTPFEATGSGDVNGYTRFRAFAVLNHGGDMSAAAKALGGGYR